MLAVVVAAVVVAVVAVAPAVAAVVVAAVKYHIKCMIFIKSLQFCICLTQNLAYFICCSPYYGHEIAKL